MSIEILAQAIRDLARGDLDAVHAGLDSLDSADEGATVDEVE